MRTLGILGLAIATLGAALIAPSGAAAEGGTILCKKVEATCAPEDRYLPPTALETKLKSETSAKIATSLGTIKCQSSTWKGTTFEIQNEETEPLKGEVSAWSLSECTLGESKCTGTTKDLPYAASFEAGAKGNGTTAFSNLKAGVPAVLFECGVLMKCTFKASELPFSFTGGNPATIAASGVKLEREGATCPTSAELSVEYLTQEVLGLARGLTLLCAANEPACSGPNTYPKNTTIESALETGTTAKFVIGGVEKTACTGSSLKAISTGEALQPLPVKLLAFTFSGCSNGCNPGFSATLATWLRAAGGGKGFWSMMNPAFTVDCPGVGACVFERPVLIPEIIGGTGATPPKIQATNLPTDKVSGGCLSQLKWTATYKVSSPSSLFVSAR